MSTPPLPNYDPFVVHAAAELLKGIDLTMGTPDYRNKLAKEAVRVIRVVIGETRRTEFMDPEK